MTEIVPEKLVRILDWRKYDVEQRIGFPGGKYTDVNNWLTLALGLLLTVVFYGILTTSGAVVRETQAAQLFLERGPTPYIITFFSLWCLAILFIKWRKLVFQQKALSLTVIPHSHDFSLAPATAKEVLDRMYGLVDDPKHFVLFSRIERALLNLHNIGMISDVSEMLRAQAENDEDQMESSYALLRGLIWGIPILGFIGTVMGLSQAIGRFGSVLSAGDVIDSLKTSLQGVTSGLAVAFDTTFVALIAALIIQLLLTALKKKEESFLDDSKDYCHRHIISKLRLSHLIDTGPEGADLGAS
ncbi:MAG: MotA/TolQ/ExbB proton channel family protein [Spartobacteria bacterium]|nr:MotA/TolQ/ExbB proton channel family protein [Spartobacteria bacterium]